VDAVRDAAEPERREHERDRARDERVAVGADAVERYDLGFELEHLRGRLAADKDLMRRSLQENSLDSRVMAWVAALTA